MLVPKRYRSVIILSVLIITSLVILSYNLRQPDRTGFLRKLVLEAAAPVEGAINAGVDGLNDAWKRYIFLIGLQEENRRLREKNDLLARDRILYREGYLEGLRLRKLLALKEQIRHETVAARVIDRDSGAIFKTLLIDRGSAQGLRVGLPVVSDQGLVGRVVETTYHISRVLLIIDENSNIDALVQGSRAQAILQGAGAAGCNLKYLPKTETVRVGDSVITSGLSGVFSKGLLIGTVRTVNKGESSLFQKIEVAPAVNFAKVEEILVILPEGEGKK
jgi:rod shape-determining protein MreC